MPIEAPFLRNIKLASEPSKEDYPFNIPLARKGFDLTIDRPVTIICGENGSGKSTLIEAIALRCGFSITGGSRNHALGEQTADVAPLAKLMKFSWSLKVSDGFFMRAESFYDFSNLIDRLAKEPGLRSGPSIYESYGGKSLHAQSHGESFIALFSNRLGRKGIYVLDEPEAALSPQRQLSLIGIIDELEKTKQAQFIIATHSPVLMAYPKATLLHLQDGEILERNFKTTTNYQILARFFANPEKYIDEFLKN